MTIASAASALESAIDSLSTAVEEFQAECMALDRACRKRTKSGLQPTTELATPNTRIVAAVASNPVLAKALGLSPQNPAVKLTDLHPSE